MQKKKKRKEDTLTCQRPESPVVTLAWLVSTRYINTTTGTFTVSHNSPLSLLYLQWLKMNVLYMGLTYLLA